MFPSHAAQECAIAFQLAAALQGYQQALDRFTLDVPDADLHATLAERFDQMQLYANALPQLSVSWVSLMISRAEFMHRFWMHHGRGGTPGELQLLLEQHREAVDLVRSRCLRLMGRATQRA